MNAILIGGEKGGTGKSMLSINIAIMASLMGIDVIHVDADPQGSSNQLFEKRRERNITPTPISVHIKGNYIHKEIEDMSKRYELIIVESGGKDSPELRSAMVAAPVKSFYTPLQPSEFDLQTISKMNELVYLAQSYNPDLKAFIVFNQSPTHSKVTALDAALNFSKDFKNLNIANSVISHRIAFSYAASQSLSVVEFELERLKSLPAWQAKSYLPKASMEICNLYEEIFGKKFAGEITQHFKTEISEVA